MVPWPEQSVFAVMSGTRHIAIGYPNDLLNRTSTGILEKPTVIDRAWETGRNDLQDQTIKKYWEVSHVFTKRIHARARTT